MRPADLLRVGRRSTSERRHTGTTVLASERHRPTSLATVALVGNPNVGKSTIFNTLTGSHQRVGNWPGKTVHVASGSWTVPAGRIELVDLPGTYSLIPNSPDETLVRDLLVDRACPARPELAVAVLDAANLPRNLYLLSQLLDTGIPVVVALTMIDIATSRGLKIEIETLSEQLGVPVIPVRPRSRQGLDHLATAVTSALGRPGPRPPSLGKQIEPAVTELAGRLADLDEIGQITPRWGAIELLTGAAMPVADGHETLGPELARLREQVIAGLARAAGEAATDLLPDDDLETAVAEQRYAWVHRVVAASVHRPGRERPTTSDRVDRVLTSRWCGLPAFFLVMWAMLGAATWLAAPLQDGLGNLLDGPVTTAATQLLELLQLDGTWAAGLVLDGLVAGVGELLTFVPLMLIMFLLLAAIEDSGYLARAAVAADRFLRMLGLPGRAFLPLIIGFGCNVPAISATRTLANGRHRVMTSLLVPYVTCSARLAVYALLASIFFGSQAGTVVFGMYLLSVLLVVLVGLTLRHTLFRRVPREPLVLELPPYRLPTWQVVGRQSWQRLSEFLRKAGGVIVIAVTVVWLLMAIPLGGGKFGDVDPADSAYGGVTRTVAPALAPAGFDDWRVVGALATGIVAKEAVVSTFAQTYHTPEPEDEESTGRLGDRLRDTFDQSSGGHTTPAVLAFLVFVLAYPPCAPTLAVQRVEIGIRWTMLGVAGQFLVAWSLATLVFQLGRMIT